MRDRLLDDLAGVLRKFADERDWGQFHSPKNLAIALTVEAAELLEEFQWLTEEQSRQPDQERLKRIKGRDQRCYDLSGSSVRPSQY